MEMNKDKLKEYHQKRNFDRTAEPFGKDKNDSDSHIFVIQKHRASRLHYDFRIETDGTLKSWAIPKGPSTDPSEKRLAIRTEDHPLEYADFEGVIPKEEYGGGTVMVWDAGTYRLIEDDKNGGSIRRAFEKGEVKIRLDGKKLRGGYVLIHTRGRGDNQWLLIKLKDDDADARRNPVSTEPKSVLSGRTLDEIAAEESSSREKN